MTPAIEVKELSFVFEDGTRALDEVSFSVDEGESVAIVGTNGAGKSTLLLHVAGILPELGAGRSTGEVFVHGQRLKDDRTDALRREVGLLFQDADDQLFCPTVGEDVAFGARQLGLSQVELARRVRESLERVGLAGFEPRRPDRLSTGQKKRAALAGLLVYEPRILVLDEPTSGLDPRGRRQLIELLTGFRASALFATHDLALVAEACSRTILLNRGRIVADGPTRDILSDDELMLAHGLECPRFDLPARFLMDSPYPVQK